MTDSFFGASGSSPPRRASLTRRHFQRLAAGIRYVAQDSTSDPATVAKLAREIANACSTFNAAFNTEHFLEACGLVDSVVAP